MRGLSRSTLGLILLWNVGFHFLNHWTQSLQTTDVLMALASKIFLFLFFTFPLRLMFVTSINFHQRGVPYNFREVFKWKDRAKPFLVYNAIFQGVFIALMVLWPLHETIPAPEKLAFNISCYALSFYGLYKFLSLFGFENRAVEGLPSPYSESIHDSQGHFIAILWALSLTGFLNLCAVLLESSGWHLVNRVGIQPFSVFMLSVLLGLAVLMQAMTLYAVADLCKALQGQPFSRFK
jgi:hypothetical protein